MTLFCLTGPGEENKSQQTRGGGGLGESVSNLYCTLTYSSIVCASRGTSCYALLRRHPITPEMPPPLRRLMRAPAIPGAGGNAVSRFIICFAAALLLETWDEPFRENFPRHAQLRFKPTSATIRSFQEYQALTMIGLGFFFKSLFHDFKDVFTLKCFHGRDFFCFKGYKDWQLYSGFNYEAATDWISHRSVGRIRPGAPARRQKISDKATLFQVDTISDCILPPARLQNSQL